MSTKDRIRDILSLTPENTSFSSDTIAQMYTQISELIENAVIDGRIDELEHSLKFREEYWATNAHRHFQKRLAQLKSTHNQRTKQ